MPLLMFKQINAGGGSGRGSASTELMLVAIRTVKVDVRTLAPRLALANLLNESAKMVQDVSCGAFIERTADGVSSSSRQSPKDIRPACWDAGACMQHRKVPNSYVTHR